MMMENMKCCAGVIHRDVATRDEFEYYVEKWLQRQYARYTLGYFAFHGVPGTILLGRDELSLEEMADIIGGGAEGGPSTLARARRWPQPTRRFRRSAGTPASAR